MGRLDDVGIKVKKRIKKRPAPFDTGDQDAMKERGEKWKNIEKEEKLEEIRKRRQLEVLKEVAERAVKKDPNRLSDAFKVWKKINYVLYNTMDRDAYTRFDAYKKTNPLLYKALLRCLVEPEVIKNIDSLVQRLYKNGPPKKRIDMKNLLWYEDHLLGRKRKNTITIKHKDEDERQL
jgi:hypothetical protein